MTPKLSQSLVESINDLPTLPEVVRRIGLMVEDPRISATEVGDLIAKDQALTAKILRLVNSPFFGFPRRISSISHAVVLLGFNVVKGLLLSTSVFEVMAREGMAGLWRHSLGCAVAAARLAKALSLPDPESVAGAGLLHDLGKVVIAVKLPGHQTQIVEVVRRNDCAVVEAEREVLGLDHCTVNRWLAEKWCLPVPLSEPMTFHHQPGLARGAARQTALVHVADVLVKAIGYGQSGDDLVPRIDPKAWQTLGLTLEGLETAVPEVADAVGAAEDFFTA